MGAWDTGPFDNDTAADWCGDLNEADAGLRVDLIRSTLETAATDPDYLDHDDAAPAIAAAAIVAASLPGGTPIRSTNAPDFLLGGEALFLSPDLPALAVRALDRIVGDDSEWSSLWEGNPAAFEQVARLRSVLAGGGEAPLT